MKHDEGKPFEHVPKCEPMSKTDYTEQAKELSFGQNLFNTINEVCGFTALEDEMQQIINAVHLDNPDFANQVTKEKDAEIERLKEKVKQMDYYLINKKTPTTIYLSDTTVILPDNYEGVEG